MIKNIYLALFLLIILLIFSYTFTNIDNFGCPPSGNSNEIGLEPKLKPSYASAVGYNGYEYEDLGYGHCVNSNGEYPDSIYFKYDNENECRLHCNNESKCTSYYYDNAKKTCFIEGDGISENDVTKNDINYLGYIQRKGNIDLSTNITTGKNSGEFLIPFDKQITTKKNINFYATKYNNEIKLYLKIFKKDTSKEIIIVSKKMTTDVDSKIGQIKINSDNKEFIKIIESYNKDPTVIYQLWIEEDSPDNTIYTALPNLLIKPIGPIDIDLSKYSTKCYKKISDCDNCVSYGKNVGKEDIGGGMGNGTLCGLGCTNVTCKQCEPSEITSPVYKKDGVDDTIYKCRSKCSPKGSNLYDCVKNCEVNCKGWTPQNCKTMCETCTNENCRWNYNKKEVIENLPSPVIIRTTQENNMIKVSWIRPTVNSQYIKNYYIVLIINNIVSVYPVISQDELLDYYITNLNNVNNFSYSCAVFSKNENGISDSSNIIYGYIKQSSSETVSDTISNTELCNRLSSNKVKCNTTPQCKFDNNTQKCVNYDSRDKVYSHEMENDIKSLLNKNSSTLNLGNNYTIYLN
jgi:hypothetical protein